ncbi:type III secretion system chaperone [Noviherbaspirillum galbum]|uniref:CesT family type III secretion system chaperone n=1 Tax=Noviherbaspirillum galbum TaxID=2709383 RepID=A0A6B3SU68_9BURK|nr:type III secretion system chaperone [Noviherbaspirillum galbum]NEX64224.1 CesT family type III secretion system chaperone [Noviherbaspirillum galbum]
MIEDQGYQLESGNWVTVETAENGERIVTMFMPRPWDAQEVGERCLLHANLRQRPGRAIGIGVFREAVVLALRVPSHQLDARTLETAVRELVGFFAMAGGE